MKNNKKQTTSLIFNKIEQQINMILFDKVLSSAEQYSLSDTDILTISRAMNVKAEVIIYTNLSRYSTMEQLFQKNNSAVVLFYPTQSSTVGHWTVILRHANGHYEFFDPYGLVPDSEIQYSDYLKANKPVNRNGTPWLTHLLQSIPKTMLDINRTQLQSHFDHVNTCGTHCMVRLLYSHWPLQEYVRLYGKNGNGYKGMSPDEIVVMYILPYLLTHHLQQIHQGNHNSLVDE